ncbi:Gag-pol polyprotein-like protein [Theobroma cacao]|uniref:Gag-pol polyprotein-like protein n=1 Tax=Theobroma cacao TaxID=3641 RepID=A0A061GRC4_THECC|nr:Gag-pol polyprotein-like protein [Theobroma cacao]
MTKLILDHSIYYIENGKSLDIGLKLLTDYSNDTELIDQLRKKRTLDIYAEQLDCVNDMHLPTALLEPIEVNEGINELDEDIVVTGTKSNDDNVPPTLEDFGIDLQGVNVNAIEHDNNRNKGVYEVNATDGYSSDVGSDSSVDYEDRLVDVNWVTDEDTNANDELEVARETLREYVKRKKQLCINKGHDRLDDDDYDDDRLIVPIKDVQNKGQTSRPNFDTNKVDGYIMKSSDKYYNPMVPLNDFVVGLRVRATCAAKNYKWTILCSWCATNKIYMVKTYEFEHSYLLITKNKRGTALVIARKYGEEITAMPFIKPKHLRALVRKDLRVRVSFNVCRAPKLEVIKKIEETYKEEYLVLNDYVEELKLTNPRSTIFVTSHKPTLDSMPVFEKIYICFGALKQGFLGGCRHIIGLDGCFLKRLIQGQLLVAVERDGNNQMFPLAWGLVRSLRHLLPLVEHKMCASVVTRNSLSGS